MQYLSDLISKEVVESWNKNNIYTIDCQTGRGKTTFCMSTIREVAIKRNKKILIFSNRKALSKQLRKSQRKDVDIITYQLFQTLKKESDSIYSYGENNRINFNDYEFVILDEIHSLFSDSAFDYLRDDCWQRLYSIKKYTIIVGLSATMSIIYNIIQVPKSNRYVYEPNYDFIENAYKFTNEDDAIMFIDKIPEDEKIIFFTGKGKVGKKLKESFPKTSQFICSENNRYYRNSMGTIIDDLAIKESFDYQLLVATKVLDNGFSIKDEKLIHVFIMFTNSIDIIQSLGRIRLTPNQKLNVYIYIPNNKVLQGSYRKICELMSIVIDWEKHEKNNDYNQDLATRMKFLEEKRKIDFKRIMNNDGTPNKTYFEYVKFMVKEKNQIKEKGYEKFVCDLLQLEQLKDLGINVSHSGVNTLLDIFKDKKLFKEEQLEFKKYLENNVCKQLVGRSYKFSINTINNILNDLEIPYFVTSHREKSNENRDKTYWYITKIKEITNEQEKSSV